MSELNKTVLQQANAAVTAGDNEGFLAFCTDDIVWSTVGGETLHGKAAVREWMKAAYVEPPVFTVHQLVGDGDFVVALGDITVKDEGGNPVPHSYSDVWRFEGGKMAELQAFVIAIG